MSKRVVKFRFYDPFNGVFTYSDKYETLALFFDVYQQTVDGDNQPILECLTGWSKVIGSIHEQEGEG